MPLCFVGFPRVCLVVGYKVAKVDHRLQNNGRLAQKEVHFPKGAADANHGMAFCWFLPLKLGSRPYFARLLECV